MHRGVIPIFMMIMAVVLVSGCIFNSDRLSQVPPHLADATDALMDLDLLEGKVNTFTLDDEIWMIDQLLSEIEAILEDDETTSPQYDAYLTWNNAFRLMSQVFKEDYMIYQSHLRQADRFYDDFNYVAWRGEIDHAKNQAARMSEKSRNAAYMVDTINPEDIPGDLQQSLRQSRSAMMEIARQSSTLEDNLKKRL